MTTRILVPTDFSQCAIAAAEYAITLARQSNAELLVAYVKPSVLLPHAEPDEADPDEPELHRQLGKTPASTVGVPVSRRFLRGNPAEELLKLARDAGVKLIVMGAHGQSVAPETPLGSIAHAVLTRAKCRVILVRMESPTV